MGSQALGTKSVKPDPISLTRLSAFLTLLIDESLLMAPSCLGSLTECIPKHIIEVQGRAFHPVVEEVLGCGQVPSTSLLPASVGAGAGRTK